MNHSGSPNLDKVEYRKVRAEVANIGCAVTIEGEEGTASSSHNFGFTMVSRALRVLCWIALAVFFGALLMAFTITASASIADSTKSFDLGLFPGGFLLSLMTSMFVGVMLAPGYVILCLFWAALGRRLGRVERSSAWFTASMLLLALPAAVIVGLRNRGAAPVGSMLLTLAATWLGLILPRFLVPSLKLGVFASVD